MKGYKFCISWWIILYNPELIYRRKVSKCKYKFLKKWLGLKIGKFLHKRQPEQFFTTKYEYFLTGISRREIDLTKVTLVSNQC